MPRLNQLEEQLVDTKALIERRDNILQLSENHLFRKVIREDFMVEEAARYVRESGDPALTDAQRQDALNIAQAAGPLKRYLNMQIALGDQAASSIENLEAAIEEMRVEEQMEAPADTNTVELG